MVKVKYIGALTTGIVSGVGIVTRNEIYDVTEDVANSLLNTSNWKKVREVKIKEKTEINKEDD